MSATDLVPPPTPPSETAEMKEARARFEHGDQPTALKLAIGVLQRNPASADAHSLLGELAMQKAGGESLAADLFRKALAARPADPVIQRLLAQALLALGNLPEAARLISQALRASPRDGPTLLVLARLHLATGRLAEAEAALRTALRNNPGWREAAGLLGNLAKRRGNLAEALVLHRRAAGSGEACLPAPGTPRRALFLVQLGAAWASLASLHAAFAADPSWQVTIVALPFRHCNYSTDAERNAVFDFLAKEGIPHVRWEDYRLQPGCADVAFLHLPYDETLPPGWHHDDLLRSVPRLVYVPYALVIVGGTENTSYQFNLPLQQRAWMVVAHSARNKAMFTRHCSTGDAHVAVAGHPKMDALLRLSPEIGRDVTTEAGGRKVVCWNPHFDFRPNGTDFGSGCSTFKRWQSFLLDEIARRPGLFLLVRPHPLFFSSMEKRKLWTPADTQAFFARVDRLENAAIDRRDSYLPAFAASAAMLSDASSLLLEFAATGRPLLYLRNPHGPGLNDHGDLIRDHLYTAETEEGIRAFLDQVERGEDPRSAGRAAALPDYILQPAEGAGAAIKRAVTARLEAETPISAT